MASLLSRRVFLKRAGGALAALTLPPTPCRRLDCLLPLEDAASRAKHSLGRITSDLLKVRAAPDPTSEVTGYRKLDDVVTLYGTAEGPGEMAHNSVWFETNDGYAYSSFVQPVARQFNRPLLPSQVSEEWPVLLKVTMPYTNVYRQPVSGAPMFYRLYYATTHWAMAVERDEAGKSWYRLRNDRGHGYYFARAEHLCPILPGDLTPISPGVADKRIDVNLTEQRLTAYEGNDAVMTASVATGTVFDSIDGVERDFRTPVGTFRVLRKRASRHMQGGTPGIDYFDLPGVPWVTYFTWEGVALHGTYWHNDYGRQRSHGCVNLTPEQARWLFLWTEPAVPAGEELLNVPAAAGTPIRVFY